MIVWRTEVDKPFPPEFLTRPKPMRLPEGSHTATFACRVQGHPLPTVSWERDGCQLSSSEHYKISRDGECYSLEIVKPTVQDSGQYVCHVHNTAGSATHNCSLLVTDVPTPKGNNNANVNNNNNKITSSSGSPSPAGTTDFRGLLKPRQGDARSSRNTADPEPRSDKEHHDFRHVLRKNSRQLPPPPSSTTTTSTLSNSPSIAASSRFLQNGSSMQSSLSTTSSLSSVSSSVSNRSGVRKNLELFGNRASPSSLDKPSLTSSSRLTPDTRPSPERSGVKSRNVPLTEARSSPVRDVRGSSALGRKMSDGELEGALTSTTVQPSQAMLTRSRERPKERSIRDAKTNSTHTFSKSLDRSNWRKSELSTADSTQIDFRSVLSKGKSVTERSKEVTTNSSSKQQPLVDFRSVLSKGKSVSEQSTGKDVVTDSSKSPQIDFRSVLSKGKSVNEQSKNVTDSSSKPFKTDVRRAVSKDKSVTEQSKDITDSSKPSKLRPSPVRDSEKNKDAKQSPNINQLDFRNVLKSRPTDDSKTPVANRDNKSKVQSTKSEIDFRSVLTRRKDEADEGKQPTESKTVQYRDSPERQDWKDSSSSDRSKLRSRFEPPSQDVNEMQLKNSELATTATTTATTINSSSQSDTPITTSSRWREEKGERPVVVTVTDNTVDEDPKPLDVISSLSDISRFDSSRFSDDLKCSDSSQLSDSAISSAFSKLSELSDLSDSSSAVSEEPLEPRISSSASRRRLGRLKERLGTGGGSGESEGVEEVSEAASIQQHLSDCSVVYGGQVVLQCKVTGVPAPDISWSVNHKAIKPSRFFQLSYQENLAQLCVTEAFSEDEGEYTCTATNSAGTDSSTCYLTVEASSSRSSRLGSRGFEGPVSTPPHVDSLTPSSLTIRRGQPASFQLTFSGAPSPEVTWYKGKRLLLTDDYRTVTKEKGTSTLTLSSVSANDSGRYTVTVSNDLGSDQLSATLSVEDVPECPVGTPHVYDISRKSVSLSWCGPAYDGGSVVTHYVVEVKESDSDKWTTLEEACTSTSYHALTLKSDTSYLFRVRAANRLGLSDPSLPTPPATMMDPLQTGDDYESDDELPFEPREVTLKPGRKFEDHFEYLHEVGRGKFGSVYKCRDKKDGKIWAAKVLKVRERDKAAVRQEVEVMNHLAHPKLLMLWDAFEAPRTMVLIMEFVSAGELFERVIHDDFVLTERDCVHFVRQICSGVGYMHSKSIVHLDLKPENVLCVAENSNQIKIIDFGLARFYKPGDSLQVLFGTPEFVAPEVINYDAISFATDLWSIGVICYILLSGLSPFQGDTDAETLANVTSGEYDFDDESFDDVSEKSKDFIGGLLVKRKEKRMTIDECEKHRWLSEEDKRARCKRLNTDRLRNFMARRKWQKTGNAIRALGRMASLQKLLTGGSSSSTGSISSVPDTPTGTGLPHTSGGAVSTPVFSPSVKTLSSAHPLAGATVKEEEEEKGEEMGAAAAATTTTTTTTTTPDTITTTTTTTTKHSKDGDNRKEDGKLRPDTNGGELTTTVASSKAATTEAVNVTTSATDRDASLIRRRQKEGEVEDSSPSPIPPSSGSLRSKLTKQNALEHTSLDVTDSGQKTSQDDKRARTATDTKQDTFSPSQTRQREKVPKEEDSNREPRPPSFVKEMVDSTAFAGDAVRFDVTVTGFPTPDIVWRLEEEEVEEDERHVIELGEHGQCSLIVRNVEEDDEGEYLCEAVNSQGEASCSAELSVYSLGV